MPKKITKKEIIRKCNEKHNNKYDYSLVDYKILKDSVKIICPIHGVFVQQLYSHMTTSGCPECNKFSKEDFIKKSNKIHNNRYDYSLVIYYNMKTKVKIICPDHGIFEQTPNSHLHNKRGCSKCTNKKWDNKIFIEKANEIHNNKFDYSLVEYINSSTKVKIICKKHGVFEQRPALHINRQQGCPICSESKGEIKINNYLEKKKLKFKRQHRFNDCKNTFTLPFDFYLPEHNICIEFDGRQHFKPINDFGGIEQFQKTKINDGIKTRFCDENNIKLIRIDYKQNIISELNKHFTT